MWLEGRHLRLGIQQGSESELSANIIKESSYDTVAVCPDWQKRMPR